MSSTQQEKEIIECPICYDEIDVLKNCVTTECGHQFHCKCLMQNSATNGFSCPMCRSVMATEPELSEADEYEEDEDEYEDRTYVEHYGEWYDDEDLRWCQYGDEYRTISDAVRYGNNYATEEWLEDNCNWSNYEDEWLLKSESTYCKFHDDEISDDNIIQVYESADFKTFEDSIEYQDYDDYEDSDRSEQEIGNSVIDYKKNGQTIYYDEPENDDLFVFVQMENGVRQYKHKKWDEKNLYEKDGTWMYSEDQKDHDEKIGQLRLFDSKIHGLKKIKKYNE